MRDSEPFWISARAATGEDGTLNWAALPNSARSVVQSRENAGRIQAQSTRASADDLDCPIVVNTGSHVPSAATATLEALNSNADAIYQGMVTAVAPGLHNGYPASLLTVRVERVIRTAYRYPTSGTIYIEFGAADFRIGDHHFCSRTPRRDDFLPRPGDDVLFFAFSPPMSTTPQYLAVSEAMLFFSRSDVLSVPAGLRKDESIVNARSVADLVTSIDRSKGRRRVER